MPGALVQRGERVTLRTVEAEDVPFCTRATANPEIRYPLGSPLQNQAQLDEMFEDDDADRFLVCLDDDGSPGQPEYGEARPIGVVFVKDADWRRPDLGYWLVPEVHGEGYGSAAVSMVVEYVFRTYDHPAVGARAYDFNEASRGLLESLGFAEEGRIHRDRFIDGEYVDSLSYVLFREDWRDERET